MNRVSVVVDAVLDFWNATRSHSTSAGQGLCLNRCGDFTARRSDLKGFTVLVNRIDMVRGRGAPNGRRPVRSSGASMRVTKARNICATEEMQDVETFEVSYRRQQRTARHSRGVLRAVMAACSAAHVQAIRL